MPLGAAYVRETTVFREYGPLSGDTLRVGYEYAPQVGGFISRQTADVDARKYIRLATNGVLAFRFRGFKSWGDYPDLPVLRRQLRAARLRVSRVHRQQGVLRRRRAALPADRSGADARSASSAACARWRSPTSAARSSTQPARCRSGRTTRRTVQPIIGYVAGSFTARRCAPVYGPPRTINGLAPGRQPRLLRPRPRDLRARLPDPLRLVVADAVQQGLGRRTSTPTRRSSTAISSGSHWLRRPKFSVWIGYDF